MTRASSGLTVVSTTSSRPSTTAPRSAQATWTSTSRTAGWDLGKINPAVPKSIVAKTLKLKQLIINGKVKPPLVVPAG